MLMSISEGSVKSARDKEKPKRLSPVAYIIVHKSRARRSAYGMKGLTLLAAGQGSYTEPARLSDWIMLSVISIV